MRVKAPYVYEADVSTSEQADSVRTLVLAEAELDLIEVSSTDMHDVMTYRTPSGRHRTLKAFSDGLFEAAFDTSQPIRFNDNRAAEANFHRRHGFLGTPDRRGRCLTEESLERFPFTVGYSDKKRTLRDMTGRASDHLVADGQIWIRVPEPVFVIQTYDSEVDPALFHYLRAQGAPSRRGVFLSIRSADPTQNSDGIARMSPAGVFNIRDLERAKAYAGEIAQAYATLAHVSIEAETRRLLEPFLFRFDRRQAILNGDLAELVEHHLDRFASNEVRYASEEAVALWLDLRRAYDMATSAPDVHRETLTPFEMDPGAMGRLLAPLRAFADAAPGLDKTDVHAIHQVLDRWPEPEPEIAVSLRR